MNNNEDELTDSELIEINNSLRDYKDGKFKHGKIDDLLKDLNDSKVEELLPDKPSKSISHKIFDIALYTSLFIIYLYLFIALGIYIYHVFTPPISIILTVILTIVFIFINMFLFIFATYKGD